jgi:hypothetical protein
MLRWIGFGIIAVIIVVAVNLISSNERKESERQYQATLAEYRSALKPGTTRTEVESYLQKQNTSFERLPAPASSDRAELGEMPRNLFCQPWKVYVDFEFKSSDPAATAARDSDVLAGVDLHREGVCF